MEKIKKQKKGGNLIILIMISVFFGLSSGLVGEIIARAYLFNNSFNVPFFAEIDFSGNNSSGSNVIITNPRKVVVEQNEKVREVAESGPKSIVGIYKRKEGEEAQTEKISKTFDPEEEYRLQNRIGEAFVITSDGWMISNFTPTDKNISKATSSTNLLPESFEDYVIIDKNKKIYNVDEIIFSPDINYSFWKIEAKDLPVIEMVSGGDLKSGQMLVGVDFDGKVETKIVNDLNKNNNLIKYSDSFKQTVNLSETAKKGFFYFSLKGGIVGFPDLENNLYLISNYTYAIDSLLNEEKIVPVNYGIYYIDLSEFTGDEEDFEYRGALIYPNKAGVSIEKGSLAEKAELQEGDILLSINNIEINKENDLSYILSLLRAKEKIHIEYLRDDKIERTEFEIK